MKPNLPRSYKDPQALLEYTIGMLKYKAVLNDYLTHNQMTNWVFGKANQINQSYITIVTHNYKKYLQFSHLSNLKFKFILSELANDFPTLANILITKKNEYRPYIPTERPVLVELLLAIDDEIKASNQETLKHTYLILDFKQVNHVGLNLILDLKLDVDQDDYLKVYEGMPAMIQCGIIKYNVEILDFDSIENILTIKPKKDIKEFLRKGSSKVILDASWLLEVIKKRIEISNYTRGFPISKLLERRYIQFKFEGNHDFRYFDKLFKDQQITANNCLQFDLSSIWGPPGTGKSHTLAYILINLLLKGEKTIVCSIANVAVDSITKAFIKNAILNKVDELTTKFKEGKIIRYGFYRDPDLTKYDFLFPENNSTIKHIRSEIQKLVVRQSKIFTQAEKISIKSEIVDLKNELKEEIKKLVAQSSIIFCTASKMHSDSIFESIEFDNLIIDEASMMSVPHFVALTGNIKKRLIIAGDFRQLGPIVLSKTALAHKWLDKDLFKFYGIKYESGDLESPFMFQLKEQKRFNDQICQLINKAFYKGKLTTIFDVKQIKLKDFPPNAGKIIAYHHLGNSPSFKCSTTPKGSRLNKFSGNYIVNTLLEKLPFTSLPKDTIVGIVTPYRAQVNEINSLILRSKYLIDYRAIIKVGTIHSFQGSEADLIIFDLVESKHLNLGLLYQHGTGKRLINVAISRAMSKLIVVGDIQAMLNIQGNNNLEPTVKMVLNLIMNHKVLIKEQELQ